jgi:hypothetical protein
VTFATHRALVTKSAHKIALDFHCIALYLIAVRHFDMYSTTSQEEILKSLVHDLLQPLANIETSLCYLDIVLHHPAGRVGEQLSAMERQVAQATQLIHGASAHLRGLKPQRSAEEGVAVADSLRLTKSATAGVA